MKSKVLRFVLFAMCALLLAACKFQATTTLNPDGSGELRTEAGFTAEERQNLENQSGNKGSGDFCNSSGQTPPDVTIAEEQRDDETWCVTTQRFDGLDELRRLYEKQKGVRINQLEISDGTLYYDVDVDTSSRTSDFSAFSAITWTVILPGTPVYYNAAQAEGNTLAWRLAPQSGTINLRAQSEVAESTSNLPLLVGGVMVLAVCVGTLLGGAGVFFLLRRSRKPQDKGQAASSG